MNTQTTEGRLIWRYATLGGAPVIVTRHDDSAYVAELPGWTEVRDCKWTCLGCGDANSGLRTEEDCQNGANRHAGACHSAPVATVETALAADPLAELAGVRREVEDLAAAVRDLALSFAKTAQADALSEVTTAVKALAAGLDRPRRSRFGRRAATPGASDEVRDALDYVIATSRHDTTRFKAERDRLFGAAAEASEASEVEQ